VKGALQIGAAATGIAVFPAPADRPSEDGIMSEAMTDFRIDPRLSDQGPESGRNRDPLAEMAEQIRLLDDAAARAAARVGEAADGLRNAPGDDSRLLADLGSSLVDRVNEISAECERLSRMLDRASKLTADARSSSSPAPAHDIPEIFKPATRNGIAPAAPETERELAPEPAPRPAPQPDRRRTPGQTTPEGVRLAATQMAVAGSSRSEIERCLRIQFGVRDADAALDEIFGTRSSEVR
jgi:hypothetical protein